VPAAEPSPKSHEYVNGSLSGSLEPAPSKVIAVFRTPEYGPPVLAVGV
jgi:hypothetical protein